jgi:hypothetical protein
MRSVTGVVRLLCRIWIVVCTFAFELFAGASQADSAEPLGGTAS